MESLETERLLLRTFCDDDISIHKVIFADPEVCRHYCGRTRTESETREWLVHRRWQAKSSDELGFLAVIRKTDNQLMGLVALQLFVGEWLRFEDTPQTHCHPLIVEISYAFGQEFQKQGYATEACRALITYGFEQMRLPRLTNGVVPENLPSIRLCERLGFRQLRNTHPDGTGHVWVLDNPST
jgi:[ribosomal protein S5]-alanine N-acetyltransferase